MNHFLKQMNGFNTFFIQKRLTVFTIDVFESFLIKMFSQTVKNDGSLCQPEETISILKGKFNLMKAHDCGNAILLADSVK